MGAFHPYRQYYNLPEGAAILSFNQWASQVSHSYSDPRGQGSFVSTTFQGRNKKKFTIICTYIAVLKGTDKGEMSVYQQQIFSMEQATKNTKDKLYSYIKQLQREDQAILLALDANQTSRACYTSKGTKPHTIEWRKIETGMDDPFIKLHGNPPPATTLHPHRDIDYILTWDVCPEAISTLEINTPAGSDHMGILIDIDITEPLGSKFGVPSPQQGHILTSQNVKARENYIKFLLSEWKEKKYLACVQEIRDCLEKHAKTLEDLQQLQDLDSEITQSKLQAEKQCKNKRGNRDPWPPKLMHTGRLLTYWKHKYHMVLTHSFCWALLANFRTLGISDEDHANCELNFVSNQC
jgi:endonuclease/exonuclease/phosphatase family metal-dependent hydrolase